MSAKLSSNICVSRECEQLIKTVIAFVFAASTLHLVIDRAPSLDPSIRMLAYLIPVGFFGYALICAFRWRRRSSLRTEDSGGGTVYTWTDIDGRQCRSDRDPRPDWDRADGGGDGDGGDGGGD